MSLFCLSPLIVSDVNQLHWFCLLCHDYIRLTIDLLKSWPFAILLDIFTSSFSNQWIHMACLLGEEGAVSSYGKTSTFHNPYKSCTSWIPHVTSIWLGGSDIIAFENSLGIGI